MDSGQSVEFAVIIPACRPSAALIQLVNGLDARAVQAIVIVDDGSGPPYREIFSAAAALPRVHVLRHAVTLGKGAALKTGMNFALCQFVDLKGIVTVEAESRHPEDVEKVAERLRDNPQALVLGRARGIPATLAPRLLLIESTGHEFECEVVLLARWLAVPVVKEPIGTDGEPALVSWPVRPFRDSMKRSILRLRYGSASAMRVARNNLVFLSVLLVLIGFVGLEIYGFRTTHLFQQEVWSPIGLKRFRRLIAGYVAYSGPLLLLVPWAFPVVAAAVAVTLTVLAAGALPLLAVLFFLLSANAMGVRLLGFRETKSLDAQVGSTLLGLSLYIFVMELAARAPVNYGWAWASLLALPILADLGGVRGRIVSWVRPLYTADLRGWGARAALALLILLLAMHWLVMLEPEVSADALAMHLAIPANIAANHRMTYEPSRFLWAVMPMGADFSYTIAYLLGGEAASRLVNFAMLLAVVALLYTAVRRWTSRALAFLIVACFAATPLAQFVTGSLFVENQLAALLLGAATALWRLAETGERRYLYLFAALGGTAIATKVGAASLVVCAVPFLAVAVGRQWKRLGLRPVAGCALAVILFALAAAPPYAISLWKTGSPLFPFMNERFHSPLLGPDADIRDLRYQQPLRWTSPFELTFETNRFWEGQDGSFGFQYLLLIPLALIGALAVAQLPVASAAVIALGSGLLVLIADPNVRYLYAALPLLFIPFAALLGALRARHRSLYAALILSVIGTTVLNAYFLPASSYYHKDFYLPFSAKAREDFIVESAPVRRVVDYLNAAHPRAPVLLTGDNNIAGLPGDVYESHWHQYAIREQIWQAKDVRDIRRLLKKWNVRYLVASKESNPNLSEGVALRRFIQDCTVPEFEVDPVYLARIEPTCRVRLITLKPGVYDDFSPVLSFYGIWTKSTEFQQAYRRSISYSAMPGATVSIAFEGSKLTYVFTKAPNRGWAQVEIDDHDRATLDLYAERVEWQSRVSFDRLGPGSHVATIRVLGQRRPAASAAFVDVDSFEVE